MQHKTTVLLVEDELAEQARIQEILAQEAYAVFTVNNGEDALRMFGGLYPSIILLDVSLPGLNGYETLTRIRALPSGHEPQIILMDKDPSEEEVARGLNLGADDYLRKSVSPTILLARMKHYMQRKEHLLQKFGQVGDSCRQGTRFIGGNGREYEILRELPHGAMGFLYAARDLSNGNTVVVKTLKPCYLEDPDYLMRFVQEAKVVQKFDHPNLVKGWGLMQTDQVCFYVMEYVAGDCVRDLLQAGALQLSKALDIAYQVSLALSYLHERGYIHRDIKPDNLVVARDGTVKLLDFGLAKSTSSRLATVPGFTMGTPFYLAPEQIYKNKVDIRSDIYALGVTLFEMIVGELPHADLQTQEILLKNATQALPPLSQLCPEVPRSVSKVVRKMTALKMQDRYAIPAPLAHDLRALLNGRTPAYV